MAVLIKGMEMPKPKLADMATIYNAYILVDPNGCAAIVVDNEDGLDSTEYSLVPVPAHSRLIDADEFLKRAIGTKCFRGDYALMLEELVGESTTIIPAENGEI